MTHQRPRTFVLASGLFLVGGVSVFFWPLSAIIVMKWLVGSLAVVTTLHVVTHTAPPVAWTSPFDRNGDQIGTPEVDEVEWIRARLAGRRIRIGGDAVAVPPETLRLLRPLVEACLARQGGAGLSPLARAVLHGDPTIRPGRWETIRPDTRAVAEIVHRVLDELERIDAERSPSKAAL